MVADVDVGGDERGPVGLGDGEDAEGLPEGDGGLVGHAGELPAADHADAGKLCVLVHGAKSNEARTGRNPVRA
ncbi:hypothetical protein Afil01_58830 [Actinorhabdospora filicis]|uniref:Uncharacterized protein n=1 Tax=Actinorhabdospora filicis TaxID=1785913 RepID=A0A9W6SRL0_9ACTN|nr:hypothetical protein Afil01_58830 [Actinorhabdospora filicis]